MTHIVKSALSRIAEESFKEFLDQDPQADDFEHWTVYSLSTDIHLSLVKLSWRYNQ